MNHCVQARFNHETRGIASLFNLSHLRYMYHLHTCTHSIHIHTHIYTQHTFTTHIYTHTYLHIVTLLTSRSLGAGVPVGLLLPLEEEDDELLLICPIIYGVFISDFLLDCLLCLCLLVSPVYLLVQMNVPGYSCTMRGSSNYEIF